MNMYTFNLWLFPVLCLSIVLGITTAFASVHPSPLQAQQQPEPVICLVETTVCEFAVNNEMNQDTEHELLFYEAQLLLMGIRTPFLINGAMRDSTANGSLIQPLFLLLWGGESPDANAVEIL